MNQNRNNEGLEVLRFLYGHRKTFLVIALLAGIMSAAVTYFIPSKYEAKSTVFPPAFNSADRMMENPQFGYNIEADRLIQIGESVLIKDSMIRYFHLLDYYEIDTLDPDWEGKLLKRYEKDVSFDRTKFMSVQITVRNEDPEMAANMANKIVDYLSKTWERLFKNNMYESLSYAEKLYFEKQKEVVSILDSIQRIRNANLDESLDILKTQLKSKQDEVEANLNEITRIRETGKFYNYSSQIEILSEEIVKGHRVIEMEKGKMKALENMQATEDSAYILAKGRYEGAVENEKYLQNQLDDLKSTGKDYNRLSENLKVSLDHYQHLKVQYEDKLYSYEPYVKSVGLDYIEAKYAAERQALQDLKRKYELSHRYYHQPLPNLFIIEDARPRYKRKSPSYLLNLVISVSVSLAFGALFLLLKDRIKEIKASLNE
jgi:capsular polysaccharide biosynthesis protein